MSTDLIRKQERQGNVLSHLSGRKLPNSGMRAKGSANEKVPRSRIHEVSDARKDTQTDAQTFNCTRVSALNPQGISNEIPSHRELWTLGKAAIQP